MASLQIELTDGAERSLQSIAAAQNKSLQELAVERLLALIEAAPSEQPGSAAALLRAMHEPPHLSREDIDALDASIATGRLQGMVQDIFAD